MPCIPKKQEGTERGIRSFPIISRRSIPSIDIPLHAIALGTPHQFPSFFHQDEDTYKREREGEKMMDCSVVRNAAAAQ